ncbi:MAG: 30S ribosomal protein S27ae [Aigarchaeota archaeon]|nr:30S ribosomal protein S27ae [Aigarchaeota archaeon]MCX8192744.1 30S ribosomal protein S27ae [Nitrososphaeria archaeon]MDW7985996.1 30S ribosomal protein S27ae [Nitrososphaerota archaeon]
MGKQVKLWKKYSLKDGVLVKRSVFCPRCGGGYIMAEHEDRYYCGNCHYTQFKT